MQENTNRAILINSLTIYGKMFINTLLSLLTTRYALQALGIMDFGLYSVLGSIITFMNIFNTIMVSTCNRFLAVAIGKNDKVEINKVFNISLTIFQGCALVLLAVGLPLGDYYVRHFINYEGPLENVLIVFYFSIIGSIVSTLATPYNGLLMAKERFFLFSFVEVITHLIRFAIALLLVYCFTKKLLIYSFVQAFTAIIPPCVYWMYCKRLFPEYIQYKFVRDSKSYATVFKFSGWVAYGAIATVARTQAAALLVNLFFNTIMNTALGIANSINQYVMLFANSLSQPMQPQITKSYAIGNTDRTDELLIMSTKFSFLLMLLIGCPFFVGADWIFGLWLGQVPPYAISFTQLLIIDNLVMSFNLGLSAMLFADGRIARYQITINTLRILAVVVAYFVLKSEAEPYYLFLTYIAFSFLMVLATQWCLKKTLNYNSTILIKQSYIPSLSVLALFILYFLLPQFENSIINIVIAMSYLILLEFLIGLSKKERRVVICRISSLFGNKAN